MEMRKFIVEIHPDGRVYASEYEEPGERQYATDYDRYDIRGALRRVYIECCSEVASAYRNKERYALDALNRVKMLIAQVLDAYWK